MTDPLDLVHIHNAKRRTDTYQSVKEKRAVICQNVFIRLICGTLLRHSACAQAGGKEPELGADCCGVLPCVIIRAQLRQLL